VFPRVLEAGDVWKESKVEVHGLLPGLEFKK